MGGHAAVQASVVFYLAQKMDLALVRAERGLVLDDSTVVACDAALLRQPITENRFLTPDDVLLVVEIAQTTQSRDMGLKRMLYAQAGIPTYWVMTGCAASPMSMPSRWTAITAKSIRCGMVKPCPCRAATPRSRSTECYHKILHPGGGRGPVAMRLMRRMAAFRTPPASPQLDPGLRRGGRKERRGRKAKWWPLTPPSSTPAAPRSRPAPTPVPPSSPRHARGRG